MAYSVSKGAGYGKIVVRFADPAPALTEARHMAEEGTNEVTITVAATGKVYTVDDFALVVEAAAGKS